MINITPKGTIDEQTKRYAEDLQRLYAKEKQKREELIVANKLIKQQYEQMKKYASDLKMTYDNMMIKTDQLIEAARFESIGKLASGCAHDFNNILMAIILYNQSILKSTNIEKIKKIAQLQNLSIEIGKNLVENMLMFTKNQKKEYSEFSPIEVINNILQLINDRVIKKSIEIEKFIEDNIILYGDKGLYSQICMNLILNSIDAIEENGKIIIRQETSPTQLKTVIEDNGKGIPEENIDKIFDLLFTTKTYGSGIGLNITKTIINRVGGRITVESELNKFTRMVILLPLQWKD